MKNFLTVPAILVFIASIFMVACDSGSKQVTEKDKANKASSGIIPEHQLNALDKAKGVEDLLLENKDKKDAAMSD